MAFLIMKPLLLVIIFLINGCTGIPDGIKPVEQFEVNRYLGKWYEIARLDHSFERNLKAISAEYSLRDDGGINVLNSGYDIETGKLKLAEGKAYFTGSSDIGSLKVSFFGPFYGGYHIIALDKKAYQYAMVTGPDRNYLWLLSRTPRLDPMIMEQMIARAKILGFEVEKLIFTEHPKSL